MKTSLGWRVNGVAIVEQTAVVAHAPGADVMRLVVGVSVVVYHCTAQLSHVPAGGLDPSGSAAAIIWVASVFGNELMIFLSLYLVLRAPAEPPRRRTLRIVRIYLTWTCIYLMASLVGLGPPRQMAEGATTAQVAFILIAGGAAYHLHFIAALSVFHATIPLWRLREPSLVLAISIALLGPPLRFMVEILILGRLHLLGAWELVLLHGVKIASFTGFALLAGNLARQPHVAQPRHLWASALLVTTSLAICAWRTVDATVAGTVLVAELRAIAIVLFACAFIGWTFGSGPAALEVLAARAAPLWLGVFMVHPLLIAALVAPAAEFFSNVVWSLVVLVVVTLALSAALAAVWRN